MGKAAGHRSALSEQYVALVKNGYQGRCTCGWRGAERWVESVALQDALDHRRSHW